MYTILVSTLGNLLLLLGQLSDYIPNMPTFLMMLVTLNLVSYFVLKKTSKNEAHHLYILLALFFYIGSNFTMENSTYAAIFIYPLFTLISIYFFPKRWQTFFYSGICMLGSCITMHFYLGTQEGGLEKWDVELVVLICSFIVFFLVGDGLVNGLRKSRNKLQENEVQLEKNQEFIEAQNNELRAKNDSLKETKVILSSKNDELEKYIESNSQLQNFAYVASHDLQAPLTSILAFSELLDQTTSGKLDDTEKRFLSSIRTSAANMKELIVDLLEFSRVDAEGINLSEFNPKQMFEGVLSDISVALSKSGAEVELMGNWPTVVLADEIKMKQVALNLVGNGVKFSREGIVPRVEVFCEEETDLWRFSVVDNGIGIPKESHDKIFQMFKRLHSQSEFKGTGIGLAMVHKLIEQHGGKISLESEQGQGSTFYFTIPRPN